MTDDIEERLRAAYAHRAEQVDTSPDLAGVGARTPKHPDPRQQQPWWRRRLVPLTVAGTLAVGSLAWVGVEVWMAEPVESPFNPGGELECSGIRTLTPAEAEAELRERGYDVQWQYHPTLPSDAIRERPPAGADVVVTEVVLFDDGSPALVLVEGFDPDDPEHRRIRAGDERPSCQD